MSPDDIRAMIDRRPDDAQITLTVREIRALLAQADDRAQDEIDRFIDEVP